jgi:hypothetical protein
MFYEIIKTKCNFASGVVEILVIQIHFQCVQLRPRIHGMLHILLQDVQHNRRRDVGGETSESVITPDLNFGNIVNLYSFFNCFRNYSSVNQRDLM